MVEEEEEHTRQVSGDCFESRTKQPWKHTSLCLAFREEKRRSRAIDHPLIILDFGREEWG
jgi:hypothetical protein